MRLHLLSGWLGFAVWEQSPLPSAPPPLLVFGKAFEGLLRIPGESSCLDGPMG